MADIGWITGHSYIVYGPLAIAASSVIYEGVPTYPDAGRAWRIAQDLDVNIFHTAPTAIRALRKIGPDEPAKYNYEFKHMTTVGEPIEPEVWKWYYNVVGRGKAAIVDTWWQTETGGFLCSTLPGILPMKPGSAGPGMPGIHPIVYDDEGAEVPTGSGKAGNICIQNPWPGMFQTIWGDRDRFVETYFARYCKNPKSKKWQDWPYMTGDAAVVAEDGYLRILGRIDDVINVSGHRLGTKEIESAALVCEEVAEAAVVPVAHEIKGKEPDLYIALKPGYQGQPGTGQEDLRHHMPPRSAKSPNRGTSGSSPTCPRRAPARSCAGCSARSPTSRTRVMSPPWRTLKLLPPSRRWFRVDHRHRNALIRVAGIRRPDPSNQLLRRRSRTDLKKGLSDSDARTRSIRCH